MREATSSNTKQIQTIRKVIFNYIQYMVISTLLSKKLSGGGGGGVLTYLSDDYFYSRPGLPITS